MDVFVARQPIFDREMNVFGYELLYRRSEKNIFEGSDDNQATAEVINNAFLTMHFQELTGGTKAFINFTNEMLVEEVPLLLPKESTVVEVLERVEINDELIAACQMLRDNGYIIALDDFIMDKAFIPLLDIAHIVKIEFPRVDFALQQALIDKYKHKIKFLAEKVETREEYHLAYKIGYDYFQGYFFSKPTVIHSKEIGSLTMNYLQILDELDKEEVDFQNLVDIIKTDVGLSYKFLKLSNSAFYGTMNRVTFLRQALVRLGTTEIRKWIYLLMLKDTENIENKELLRTCLTRAKFMELLAVDSGQKTNKMEYFLVGMLSEIDVLLNREMKDIINELALTPIVKNALLGKKNDLGKMLNLVIEFEKFGNSTFEVTHTKNNLMDNYIKALAWGSKVGYD